MCVTGANLSVDRGSLIPQGHREQHIAAQTMWVGFGVGLEVCSSIVVCSF